MVYIYIYMFFFVFSESAKGGFHSDFCDFYHQLGVFSLPFVLYANIWSLVFVVCTRKGSTSVETLTLWPLPIFWMVFISKSISLQRAKGIGKKGWSKITKNFTTCFRVADSPKRKVFQMKFTNPEFQFLNPLPYT